MKDRTEIRITGKFSYLCTDQALNNLFELVEIQDDVAQRTKLQIRDLRHTKTPLASQGKMNN
jgi:hypothetical protein